MEQQKNKTTALLLSGFLGGLGVDRFYLGYTGIGILKLLTLGCCGILTIIDFIMICTGSLQPANGLGYEGDNVKKEKNQINKYEDLEKIAKLHKDGVINDEEYENMKKEAMGK